MQTALPLTAVLNVVLVKLQAWQRDEVQQVDKDINVLQDQLTTASDIYHWGRSTRLLTPQTLATLSQQLQEAIALQTRTCTHRREVKNLVPGLRIACPGLEDS